MKDFNRKFQALFKCITMIVYTHIAYISHKCGMHSQQSSSKKKINALNYSDYSVACMILSIFYTAVHKCQIINRQLF